MTSAPAAIEFTRAMPGGVDAVDERAADERGQVDTRGQVEIGMPAGLAEHVDRHQQPRTGDQPVGHGLTDAGVDAHQVARGGDPVLQRHPQPLDEREVAGTTPACSARSRGLPLVPGRLKWT